MIIDAGSVNVSAYFYIVEDASNTNPGDPLAGLTVSNLDSASYVRQGGLRQDVPLVSQPTPSSTHVDGGFIEVDATNCPGFYRCDFPDAAFSAGVSQVYLHAKVAAASDARVDPITVDLEARHTIRKNRSYGGASNTLILDLEAEKTADIYNGNVVMITTPSSAAGQTRLISDYAFSGDVHTVTVDPAWTTIPPSDSNFVIHPAGRRELGSASNTSLLAVQADMAGLDSKIPDILSLANINAQVDTALIDIHLDHLVIASGTVETEAENSAVACQTDLTEATDNHYEKMMILFTSGPEAGQSRTISSYRGDSGQVKWATPLTGVPASGTSFVILPDDFHVGFGAGISPLAAGLTQSASSTTVQLEASSNFIDGELDGNAVNIVAGIGAGQTRVITAYTGATDTATVSPAWITVPTPSSAYEVVSGIASIEAIQRDAQSATNLKDFIDTGYDPLTNQVEGVKLVDTTTTNTDMRGTDNAALAVALGGLADAAATGDPDSADTLMSFAKQLVNVLTGGSGIATWPAAAAPADGVSIAEALRAVYDDTNDMQPKIGTPATDLAADIAVIEGYTDDIGVAGAGLTDLGGMSIGMKAEIEAEANDALVAQNLDHLAGDPIGIPAIPSGTYLDQIMDDGSETFNRSTDSLQALRDRGDAAWTTGVGGSDRLLMVDTTIATLSSQTSFTLSAGSTDDNAYVNCTIVIEDVTTATQKAVGLISAYTGSTRTVTLKYDPGIFTMQATDKVYILAENSLKSTAQNTQLDVVAITSDVTAIHSDTTAIASDVVEVYSDTTAIHSDTTVIHSDTLDIQTNRLPSALVGGRVDASVGSMATDVVTAGAIQADAIGSAELAATAITEIVNGILDELIASHTGAGSVGNLIERLDLIATGGAGELTTTRAANLDNADATVSSRATPAQVATEISDALTVDVRDEEGSGQPPLQPTLKEAIMYLYMALRNKIDVDSGFKEFYNNANTVIWKKALTDDGSNYTEAVGETGP